MKKFFIAVVTVVCLLSLTPKAKVKAYDNSEFKSQTIIKELHADLTGDHIEEYVVLTGLKNQDSPFHRFISFLAFVTSDRVQMVKFYPESNAETRLQLRGRGYLYYYCTRHGLFQKKV